MDFPFAIHWLILNNKKKYQLTKNIAINIKEKELKFIVDGGKERDYSWWYSYL